MNFDFETLSNGDGKTWMIQWLKNQEGESICFSFRNDTEINSEVLNEIRRYGAWHLYCRERWAGRDLSVFRPVAEQVQKISLPAEKKTQIYGLESFVNLATLSISGDISQVDFTKFSLLRDLSVNENSKSGNWHLCESLEQLMVSVSMANLKKLKALKNLKNLSSTRALKSSEGIGNLSSLREFRVGNCHLASLESLGSLPQLKLLLLNLMPKLESLKGIEGLSGLEDLEVSQCGGLTDVSAISQLKKLKMLQLAFCPHIKTLDNVKLPGKCQVDFVPGGKVSDGY